MKPGYSYTKKEALQYENAGNSLVDFFRSAAAQRPYVLANSDNLFDLFKNAYSDNKEIAAKLVFWLRDPRKGAGERAASRKLFGTMFKANKDFIYDNLDNIVKHGYWKDLILFLDIDDSNVIPEYWAQKIVNGDRLAAKWAPRLHSKYHNAATRIREAMQVTNAEYRKILKDKSNTVEQIMSQNRWNEIIYDHIPSNALKNYKDAFRKNDHDRFIEWMNSDKTKANAAVVYPHEILMLALQGEDTLAQKMWDNLPNFIPNNEKFMVILNTSGSMESFDYRISKLSKKLGSPLVIGVALTLYLIEKNKSVFKNLFMTFNSKPNYINLNVKEKLTLSEKYKFIRGIHDWGGSTNLEAAYRLILDTAVQYDIPEEDMPSTLLILSDMQFDSCIDGVLHIENIRNKYKDAGYKLPKIVFWNLNEAFTGSPAAAGDNNIGLVSGFSPSLMEAVLANKSYTPIDLVNETVKKYDDVDCKNLPDLSNILDAINDYGKTKNWLKL